MKQITNKSSKKEEIEALRDFASSIGPDTYLSELFSPKFLDWVENEMMGDFPVDVMEQKEKAHESYEKARKDVTSLEEALEEARESNRTLREQLTRMTEEAEKLDKENARQKSNIEENHATMGEMSKHIESLRDQVSALMAIVEQSAEAGSEPAEMALTLIRLGKMGVD